LRNAILDNFYIPQFIIRKKSALELYYTVNSVTHRLERIFLRMLRVEGSEGELGVGEIPCKCRESMV